MPEERPPIDALVTAWARRADVIPLAVLSPPVARLTEDLPAFAFVCHTRRAEHESLAEHGVLVMIDADDSELWTAPFSALGAEPVATGIEADVLRIDLRRLIPAEKKPKHVLVRALVRQQVSDARPIQVTESRFQSSWTGSDGAWARGTLPEMTLPELTMHDVAPLGASQTGDDEPSHLLAWPPPADPFPSYLQRPTSPALPDLVGIELTAPRVLVREPDAHWILEGSFRLSARVEDRAPPPDAPPIEGASLAPTAIVRGALVVVGSDEPGPWVVPLRLPSYAPIHPTRLTATATGFFAIDLLASCAIPACEQSYFVHLFAGNAHAGPCLSALLTPETVRAEIAAATTPV